MIARPSIVLAAAALAAACGSGASARDTTPDTARADSTHLEADVSASHDSVPARDTAHTPSAGEASHSARGRSAAPASGGAATTPSPATATRPAAPAPQRTSAAPGADVPASGSGRPALVVFRDTVLASDVEWLEKAGFVVEQVNPASHSVTGRVSSAFKVNPRSNPRVLRFNVAMR